ncbi:MAG: ester cyclase [Tunicatimonas sp.]
MQDPLETNKALFERFIQLLNEQRLEELSKVVDPERYHEQCIGYAPGWMNLYEAKQNLRKVYQGIPDLHARIETMTAEGNAVTARVTVTGTHRGTLFGAPATGRFFQVNGFDSVEIEEGKIVRRIQQADLAGQMGQLFGPWLKGLGVALGVGVVGMAVALGRK